MILEPSPLHEPEGNMHNKDCSEQIHEPCQPACYCSEDDDGERRNAAKNVKDHVCLHEGLNG